MHHSLLLDTHAGKPGAKLDEDHAPWVQVLDQGDERALGSLGAALRTSLPMMVVGMVDMPPRRQRRLFNIARFLRDVTPRLAQSHITPRTSQQKRELPEGNDHKTTCESQ